MIRQSWVGLEIVQISTIRNNRHERHVVCRHLSVSSPEQNVHISTCRSYRTVASHNSQVQHSMNCRELTIHVCLLPDHDSCLFGGAGRLEVETRTHSLGRRRRLAACCGGECAPDRRRRRRRRLTRKLVSAFRELLLCFLPSLLRHLGFVKRQSDGDSRRRRRPHDGGNSLN